MNDENKSIFEYLSRVDELVHVSDFMESRHLDEAMNTIVKLVSKPDIPPQVAAQLIVQLQAISATCAIRAAYYKNFFSPKAGSDEYKKKNMFYTLHEAINEVVAALKYNIRSVS